MKEYSQKCLKIIRKGTPDGIGDKIWKGFETSDYGVRSNQSVCPNLK
ncbi:MAG: hypothetical protein WB511_15455 [Nitrososphaeraceae archaeon]